MKQQVAFGLRGTRACCRALVVASLVAPAMFAAAQATAPREIVRGTIASVQGPHLNVKTNDGKSVDLQTTDSTRVNAVTKASLDQVAKGAFVGTAATPNAQGELVAQEVHIFAESMRGTGEGHRPFNLGPRSTMTNATVSTVAPATTQPARTGTMTNATVSSAGTAEGGRRITLTYKDGDKQGEKVVVVPPNVPVVMMQPGERSLLAPGAHVTAFGARQPDGTLAAASVSVGKDGLVPPM